MATQVTLTAAHSFEWRIPKEEQSSLVGKMVEWVREDRPFTQKICVYALATLAGLVMFLTLIGIPVVIYAIACEWDRQVEVEEEDNHQMLELLQRRLESGSLTIEQALKQALEGKDLEKFELLDPMGRPGYIDFLMPEKIKRSSTGFDASNRPFYILKIKEKSTEEEHVVTLFQQYINVRDRWIYDSKKTVPPALFSHVDLQASEIVSIYNLIQNRGAYILV